MSEDRTSREKKILSILDQEIKDGEQVAADVRVMAEQILINEKGYLPGDIEKEVAFDVVIGQETVKSGVDILVTIDNRKAMAVKCAPGSLESRERQVIAAARLLGDFQIPVAVVMDPATAIVLDAVTGKTMGEGDGAIPTKEQLQGLLAAVKPANVSPEKVEREKRVLLAFDAIRCSIPQGENGGVQIDDACEEK